MSPEVYTSGQPDAWHEQAEGFFAEARKQRGIRLPSDRRHAAPGRSERDDVAVPDALLKELGSLSSG